MKIIGEPTLTVSRQEVVMHKYMKFRFHFVRGKRIIKKFKGESYKLYGWTFAKDVADIKANDLRKRGISTHVSSGIPRGLLDKLIYFPSPFDTKTAQKGTYYVWIRKK